jgi:hypothetical protein
MPNRAAHGPPPAQKTPGYGVAGARTFSPEEGGTNWNDKQWRLVTRPLLGTKVVLISLGNIAYQALKEPRDLRTTK